MHSRSYTLPPRHYLFYTSVVDGRASLYVINDTMRHRIIRSRLATRAEGIVSGAYTYIPKAIVDTVVHLNIGDERVHTLTLKDTVFVPDFFTNLVSIQKLNVINVHYNTNRSPDRLVRRTIPTKEPSLFCLLKAEYPKRPGH
jgi:hypothetical protein